MKVIDDGNLFHIRLKSARRKRGMTIAAFASEINKSVSQVARYENDNESERQEPDATTLKMIAVALNVSVDYLLGLRKVEGTVLYNQHVIDYHSTIKHSMNNFSIYWLCHRCSTRNVNHIDSLHKLKIVEANVEWTCELCGNVHTKITKFDPNRYVTLSRLVK